jgi:ferredoxin
MTLRGVPDRLLRLGKYVLLFFTAYFTITSSELWCKKFDPYFASVTGFGVDTVLLWGLVTLGGVLILSVIIRFFWCKYACPLSALSNIFSNFLITAPLIIIYLVIRLIGLELHVLWLILALCVSGALIEVFRFKFFSISAVRVTIDKNYCTVCQLCNKSCPQGIEVHKYEKVTHPDCNLCMDCVKACKTDKSIGLNKSRRLAWFPPVALVVLFGLGLAFAQNFQFKTLGVRWGNHEELSKVEKLRLNDLRSVKCFGSARSLQNKLMRVPGIVGLDAYAKDHHVVIYYDPATLDESGIKQAVFTPSRQKVRNYRDLQPTQLEVFEIGVNGLWDVMDNRDLIFLLRQNKYVSGFETHFGEPVQVLIYCESGKVAPEELVRLIGQKSYTRTVNDKTETIEVDFDCVGGGAVMDTVTFLDFQQRFFAAYDQSFNNYKDYNPTQLQVLEVGLPDAENVAIRRRLPYLASHISFDDGAVRLRTVFIGHPVLQVFFDPEQVSAEELNQRLREPVLQYLSRDDSVGETENIFQFGETFQVVPYIE